MTDSQEDLSPSLEEELIRFIAQSLVENPDGVDVYIKQTRRTDILKLQVDSDDMGRVIGRNGRVANAMRSLLDATAYEGDRPVILEID